MLTKLFRFSAVLCLIVLLAGCGVKADSAEDSAQPNTVTETGNSGQADTQQGTTNQNNSDQSVADAPANPGDTTKDTTNIAETQDSGTYIGRIDNNSVEIKISGVPDQQGNKAFQLSDKLIDELDSYGLQSGDEVKFSYQVPVDSVHRPVLIEISKIKN